MAWIHELPLMVKKYGPCLNLYPIGDIQYESKSSDHKWVKYQLEKIADDPIGVAIFTGDIEDCDRPSTRERRVKAFSDRPDVINQDAKKHMAYIDQNIVPLLRPLAELKGPGGHSKIMGGLAGHHWTRLTSTMNSVQYLFNKLSQWSPERIEYFGVMSMWLKIKIYYVGRIHEGVLKIGHIQHGAGMSTTLGGTLNKLIRTKDGLPADFYARAHDCRCVSAKEPSIEPRDYAGSKKLKTKEIAYLNIGSATRSFQIDRDHEPDYAEMGMLRPACMNWGRFEFVFRRSHLWEDSNRGRLVDIFTRI